MTQNPDVKRNGFTVAQHQQVRMKQEAKSEEELHTSILSLWQIPDSQRRSNMSISSARRTKKKKGYSFTGENYKRTKHSSRDDPAVTELGGRRQVCF